MHETYTKTFAGNAGFYDPENGGAPRPICQAAGFLLFGQVKFADKVQIDFNLLFPHPVYFGGLMDDKGGGGPFVGVCSRRAHAHPLSDGPPMGGGGEYPLGGQFLRNSGDGLALDNALEDAPDNGGGFLIQNPLLAVVRVVQIAVGQRAGDVLSRRRPRAENRPYLPAGISGVPRDTVL